MEDEGDPPTPLPSTPGAVVRSIDGDHPQEFAAPTPTAPLVTSNIRAELFEAETNNPILDLPGTSSQPAVPLLLPLLTPPTRTLEAVAIEEIQEEILRKMIYKRVLITLLSCCREWMDPNGPNRGYLFSLEMPVEDFENIFPLDFEEAVLSALKFGDWGTDFLNRVDDLRRNGKLPGGRVFTPNFWGRTNIIETFILIMENIEYDSSIAAEIEDADEYALDIRVYLRNLLTEKILPGLEITPSRDISTLDGLFYTLITLYRQASHYAWDNLYTNPRRIYDDFRKLVSDVDQVNELVVNMTSDNAAKIISYVATWQTKMDNLISGPIKSLKKHSSQAYYDAFSLFGFNFVCSESLTDVWFDLTKPTGEDVMFVWLGSDVTGKDPEVVKHTTVLSAACNAAQDFLNSHDLTPRYARSTYNLPGPRSWTRPHTAASSSNSGRQRRTPASAATGPAPTESQTAPTSLRPPAVQFTSAALPPGPGDDGDDSDSSDDQGSASSRHQGLPSGGNRRDGDGDGNRDRNRQQRRGREDDGRRRRERRDGRDSSLDSNTSRRSSSGYSKEEHMLAAT